jgi:hypothetical protein
LEICPFLGTAGYKKNIHTEKKKEFFQNFEKSVDNMTVYRILNRMKVTAILADDLVNDVKAYTRRSTVTETLAVVLKEWIDLYNIRKLNRETAQSPIVIDNGQNIREINRQK